jgi:hypothetical protein
MASNVESLKLLSRYKWLAICCSLIALALSLIGLLGAAIHPDLEGTRPWIWLFTLYAVILCPGGAIAYGMVAANKEREIV